MGKYPLTAIAMINTLRMFLLLFAVQTLGAKAQCIDSLFAQVPIAVMPLLDETSRLDLIDLYNSKLPAKAENRYGGQSELLEKTPQFMRLRSSGVGEWQFRLLPAERDTLIACIRSVKSEGVNSWLEVYNRHWKRVKIELPNPPFSSFYVPVAHLSPMREQVLGEMLREAPIQLEFNDKAPTLTCSISTEGLSEEDKADAQLCLHPVVYEWVDGKFVLRTSQPVHRRHPAKQNEISPTAQSAHSSHP